MSQSFNDPMENNPNAAPRPHAGGGAPLPGGQPAGGPGYPPGSGGKPKSIMPWILGILGVLAVLTLVCCGGLVYLGFQAQGQLAAMTGEIFREQYAEGLNANPDFAENVGEVESMSMNFTAIGEVAQENPNQQGAPWLVFDVQGTQADAMVRIRVREDGSDPQIADAILILGDGTELPMEITVKQPSFGETEFGEFEVSEDFDLGEPAAPEPASPSGFE